MTRRTTMGLLAAVGLAFAVRMAFNAGPSLRSVDEAHFCAAAARVVGAGGPLYGNALASKGPVLYAFTAAVFRVAGLYGLVALRSAAVAWWLATALVVYGSARTVLGRPASLAAATAYLLAAMSPGFQAIRADALAALPLAAAFGLVQRGVRRQEATTLALAGGAVAVAFLTKQQAGLALPAVAACPLLCGLWPRRREEAVRGSAFAAGGPRAEPPAAGRGRLWLALCGSALIVAGFLAAAGAVWLWYVARGAGHEFVYCVWTYNWAFLGRTPAGGYLPTLGFFGRRVVRYVLQEPLLPMAVVGAAAGVAWRGPAEARQGAVPWRARVLSLAALLAALWLAATPADIPAPSDFSYVTYVALLYAPMCLLLGVAVEVGGGARDDRRLALVALASMAAVYGLVAAFRPIDPVWFRLPHELTARATKLDLAWLGLAWRPRIPGTCFFVGAIGGFALAAWLFGGARLACAAAAVWAVLYVSAPGSLGWMGSHAAAAAAMVGLGLLWRGSERGSLALVAAAALVQAAGCRLDWLPQAGLGLGAALWLWRQRRRDARERTAFVVVYLVPVLAISAPLLVAQLRAARGMRWPWQSLPETVLLLGDWLAEARLPAALAAVAVLLSGEEAGAWRQRWARAMGSRAGLLVLAGLGSLAGAALLGVSRPFLATPGAAVALLAAAALSRVLRRATPQVARAGSWLLVGGCAVAAAAALAIGLRAPDVLKTRPTQLSIAEAIRPSGRAYVWGTCFQTDLYVLAGAVPAAPQVYTWMMPATQPGGLALPIVPPPVATLDGLDHALTHSPPPCLVIGEGMPGLEGLPRFGPIFRARYRLVRSEKEAKVFRLAAP